MATLTERIEYGWERSYPVILGFISIPVVFWKIPIAFEAMIKAGWKTENIYSSAFNIATVATPFLFTFYTIFVTTETGFIGRMKSTNSYRMTVRYTLRAIWLGALLSVTSLPLIVASPTPTTYDTPWIWIVSAWSGLVVATLAAFVRAARQFGVFINVHAKH